MFERQPNIHDYTAYIIDTCHAYVKPDTEMSSAFNFAHFVALELD